jgi:lysophospholipase L1-like esterase
MSYNFKRSWAFSQGKRVANTGDLAALSAAFVPKATNTVTIFGDSITAQNGTGTSTLDPASGITAVAGRGYWNWANSFLYHRATLVRNAGVGGNVTAQMLARMDTDVLAYNSDWLIVAGGANDVTTDVPAATTIANLTAILDKAEVAGRRVLVLTVPPSVNTNSAGRRAALTTVNRWIINLPFTRRNTVVCDVWRVLADPTTGAPATGMTIDGVHPSDMGALRMGKAIANVLDPLMSKRPYRTIGLLDSENVFGGSFASSTGWSVTGGNVVPTYGVAADDRWSKKVSLAISGVTDSAERGITYIEPIANGRYAAGDVIQGVARFKWSGASAIGTAGIYAPFLRLYPRLADNSFGNANVAFSTASGEYQTPVGNDIAAGEVVVLSYRTTLPANIANLYVMVGFRGMAAGTVEVSDLSVWKAA